MNDIITVLYNIVETKGQGITNCAINISETYGSLLIFSGRWTYLRNP